MKIYLASRAYQRTSGGSHKSSQNPRFHQTTAEGYDTAIPNTMHTQRPKQVLAMAAPCSSIEIHTDEALAVTFRWAALINANLTKGKTYFIIAHTSVPYIQIQFLLYKDGRIIKTGTRSLIATRGSCILYAHSRQPAGIIRTVRE